MTQSDAQVAKGANYRTLYRKSVAESLKAQKELEKARGMIREQKSYVVTMGHYTEALAEENRQLKEDLENERSRTNHKAEILVTAFVAVILIVLYLGGK